MSDSLTIERPNPVETKQCIYKDAQALYLAYMPFLQNGGLFIRSKTSPEFGMNLHLAVSLPDDKTLYECDATVVWITPPGVQGNKPAGYGVAFNGDAGNALRTKIEKALVGFLNAKDPTDTF